MLELLAGRGSHRATQTVARWRGAAPRHDSAAVDVVESWLPCTSITAIFGNYFWLIDVMAGIDQGVCVGRWNDGDLMRLVRFERG